MPIVVGLTVLFFWFFKEAKAFLFWTYLWQLKNYHIGRFLAHFDTYKGRKVINNPGAVLKYVIFFFLLLILGSSYAYPEPFNGYILKYGAYIIAAIPLLFLIYIVEGMSAVEGMIKRRIKVPEMTSKVSFLLPIIFIPLGLITAVFARIFIYDYLNPSQWTTFDLIPFSFFILAFDILTPLIVSFIVLFFQPITVLLRNRIIGKAKKRKESLENLLAIGITGSYGKSSTKEFLKFILSKDFKVVSTEKNENSEMGISQCILNTVKDDDEIFICEMGAYNRGGVKLLCDIVKPKVGILTGINNQHLATFGSQKNIIKGKFEMIDSLPEEGLAVLNWDSEFVKDNFNSKVSSVKYSVLGKQDIWAEDIKGGKEGISFKVVFKTGESYPLSVNVNGKHNVPNLLAAIAVAKKLGMDMEDIVARLKEIKGGMKIKKYNGFDVIDATYSSNFNGIISHLEYLKNWGGKKVLVMPCLIELGVEGKETHRKIGKKIGEVCDLAIITSRDYLEEIKKGAVEAGMKKENILFMDDGEKIFKKLFSFAKEGGAVMLESRVPQKLIDKLIN